MPIYALFKVGVQLVNRTHILFVIFIVLLTFLFKQVSSESSLKEALYWAGRLFFSVTVFWINNLQVEKHDLLLKTSKTSSVILNKIKEGFYINVK